MGKVGSPVNGTSVIFSRLQQWQCFFLNMGCSAIVLLRPRRKQIITAARAGRTGQIGSLVNETSVTFGLTMFLL
jgi:hypothetical protein